MQFVELSDYFTRLEETSSRNLMTEILAELYGLVGGDEIAPVCYLSLGQLRPKFDKLEFSLADKMVVRALAGAYGMEQGQVWGDYKKRGDLGLVAHDLHSKSKKHGAGEGLSIEDVYELLIAIAREQGQGSQERKTSGLIELIGKLDPMSVKYVVRMVLGRLRLGFSDKTMLDALSVMDQGSKTARKELELSYQVFPDIGEIASLVKKYGIAGVSERVEVTLGVPVLPALCQRLKTAEEMITKMGEVYVEPKFDGTRVQIHFNKSNGVWVKTFTRNMDETTHMFPELGQIANQIDANEVILDSEAMGYNPKTGKMLPFQETITRKRKHAIEDVRRTVPLKFMVFDVLYRDGKSLVAEPLSERRKQLESVIKNGKVLELVEVIVTDDPNVLRDYHGKQLGAGLEGAVIKQVESVYEPGRRGWSWVKFKEVEEAAGKLSDTLDCVVMGFYRGRGKRAQFGIGAFLVGVTSNEKILTVAKIGTGLSDAQWKEMRKRLENEVSVEQPKSYVVEKSLVPDVWVDPKVVVEIAADEITKSPVHSAGLALRFPRLVRFRDDKDLSGVTTKSELFRI